MLKKLLFTKSAGAGAKCDHFKLEVCTRVRAHLNLDVRGACVRPKKRSQPMPWKNHTKGQLPGNTPGCYLGVTFCDMINGL